MSEMDRRGAEMNNEIVKASERIAYGFTDVRAVFGSRWSMEWQSLWMAVSCCCGLTGPSEEIPHWTAANSFSGLPLPR